MLTNRELNQYLKQNGLKLKKLRKMVGLTQRQLHEKTGIAKAKISLMESGKVDFQMTTYIRYIKGLRK